jgi:RND family efflux transporter MFP subunit
MSTENIQLGNNDPAPANRRRLDWRLICIALVAVVLIAVLRGLTGHAKAQPTATNSPALPAVAVARVAREDLYNEITIPAEFRPYLQVELHAKISGYLEQINVDIGDRVKAGQLLAVLEMPELKSDLDRAMAAAQRTEVDYKDVHLVYQRLKSVNQSHPNLVAQQELDAAEAKDSVAQAAIAAAKAEVEKFQTMLAYTRITAPFDGVITHRYADPGSLIQAGTSSDTQSRPLVRLSDNYRLRLDFPVSVGNIRDIRVGDTVTVRVQSSGGKTFTGTISRCAQKVDEDTRTMNTEIEVSNPNLELVPGMYATLVLKVEKRPQVLTVPTEAVSTGKSPNVYLVNGRQELEERPVVLGIETAGKYEVLSGLKEGDLVMIGNRSEIKPGQRVTTKFVDSLAQQ